MPTAALHDLAAMIESAVQRDQDHLADLDRTWMGASRHRFDHRHGDLVDELRRAHRQVEEALAATRAAHAVRVPSP